MLGKAVGIIGRLVGKAAAHMVDSDNPVIFLEKSDEMAKVIRPGRIAVHHDHNRAGTLIDIMESAAV